MRCIKCRDTLANTDGNKSSFGKFISLVLVLLLIKPSNVKFGSCRSVVEIIMVYKEEEVIGWFRDLFSWRKIELLCTFLRMCHPLELRFIGSYVEQLARTDFMALRDAEAKVNEANDLKRSLGTELDSETLAGRTIIALSLLRSTNRAAAHVIFNALNHLVTLCEDSIDVGVLSVQSDKNKEGGNSNKSDLPLHSTTITKELMLSLTLAIHHPAFVFSECLQLQKCLKASAAYLCEQYEM